VVRLDPEHVANEFSDHDDLRAAGFIGRPEAPNVTLNEAIERYGADPIKITPYMVMLCGGLVATVGDADPDRLEQSLGMNKSRVLQAERPPVHPLTHRSRTGPETKQRPTRPKPTQALRSRSDEVSLSCHR
jgi:hypothetical protein